MFPRLAKDVPPIFNPIPSKCGPTLLECTCCTSAPTLGHLRTQLGTPTDPAPHSASIRRIKPTHHRRHHRTTRLFPNGHVNDRTPFDHTHPHPAVNRRHPPHLNAAASAHSARAGPHCARTTTPATLSDFAGPARPECPGLGSAWAGSGFKFSRPEPEPWVWGLKP
ncbi:hypothetical protein B0H16DRAFT_1484562 [Mycena metata]|uniref:Uncharacterized protein n=1 Tax=Mycena metata TaxID=1033252 RepID=A0AAD7GPN4_9AGAR|nr:hypothetical protein B0H16DRAFT_1484562 [Mycena metata]